MDQFSNALEQFKLEDELKNTLFDIEKVLEPNMSNSKLATGV